MTQNTYTITDNGHNLQALQRCIEKITNQLVYPAIPSHTAKWGESYLSDFDIKINTETLAMLLTLREHVKVNNPIDS